MGASVIFCLAESSLSFSGVPRSLLLESPPPPSCAVFPAAPPAGTRVPPGRACGCPECIRPAEHQTPFPESESPGTSAGICTSSRYHLSASGPHEVPRGCMEWTKKDLRKKERHAVTPGPETPGNASPDVVLLFYVGPVVSRPHPDPSRCNR